MPKNQDTSTLLPRLRQIVVPNLQNEQFGVEDLARAAGLTRSALPRRLNQTRGPSISRFMRTVRLGEAHKLLEAGAPSSSEVAFQVGFNSNSYFHKCFREWYGYSPGELSEKLRSEASEQVNEPSLAVLPLEPLGPSDQQYLAAGVQDALIGELGKIQGMRVISRTSTLPYAGSRRRIADIARELGVNLLIEGSVFPADGQVRIQLQLIEVFPKERHLWAQEYYQPVNYVLSLRSDMVRDIAKGIRISIQASPLAESPVRHAHPEAYKHYLRGMYFLQKGAEGFQKGINFLRQAVEIDPADPFGYAGLAVGYAITSHGPNSVDGNMHLAKAAALRALELDDSLANAHTALGMAALYMDWDWAKAEKSLRKALAINPNHEHANAHLAWLLLLMDQREEAVHFARKAVEIDPLSPTLNLWLGWILLFTGQPDEAERWVRKSLALLPGFSYGQVVLGNILLAKGRFREALDEHEKLSPEVDFHLWMQGVACLMNHQPSQAADRLQALEALFAEGKANPVYLAGFYFLINRKDEAYDLCDLAIQEKVYPLPWIKYAGIPPAIMYEARFRALYKRIRLPLV